MNFKRTIEIAVMIGSALLEVGGDALIRKGMTSGGMALIALGFALLGSYGVLLVSLELDFSRLLGAYVGIFALTSMLFGRVVFGERINGWTWLGVGVVLLGSLIIQYGVSSPS